jgi:hypothetical protein
VGLATCDPTGRRCGRVSGTEVAVELQRASARWRGDRDEASGVADCAQTALGERLPPTWPVMALMA